jgi:L-rhamnose mutarotase
MPSNEDKSPVSVDLDEVFHIANTTYIRVNKPAVVRTAFAMSVNPDKIEEYTRRHNPIWKELENTLIEHGVVNYSIHLLPNTLQLFAYAEIESEQRWSEVAKTEICQKWWEYMGDVMPSNEDKSPVSVDLDEVFHVAK